MALPLQERQHFFRLINGQWSFIANFSAYTAPLIAVEKWHSEKGTTYVLCLRVYTKSEASNRIDQYGKRLMDGPEIYYVMREDRSEPSLIAYKPDMVGAVELQHYESRQQSVMLEPGVSFDVVKQNMKHMLCLDNARVTELVPPTNLFSIQYNF